MWSSPIRWLTILALSFPLLDAHADNDVPPPQLVRTTEFGKIEGVANTPTSKTLAWKGVPYAKAPVGNLRWKAPVDPDRWNTVLSSKQCGNACAQYGRIYGPGANN